QVDDGEAVAHGDFLRAQNLGDGLGPPGAGLNGGVVGDDDGGAALDFSEAGDDTGGGSLPVVAVVGDEESDFEEVRVRIDERGDAFAGGEFAGLVLAFDTRGSAAVPKAGLKLLKLIDEEAHVRQASGVHGYLIFEKSA